MALALGTRRSTAAAVGSVIAAIAFAAAVAGRSCRVVTAGPEVTVRDLLTAAKAGDRDTIFELLTPATRDALEASAKRATDLVGAAVRFSAKDLISIGAFDSSAAPTDITVIEQHGDHAIVEIVAPGGRSRLDLVEADGRWRVDLAHYGNL